MPPLSYILIFLFLLGFLGLQLYPYFKLRSSLRKRAPALNPLLSPTQRKQPRLLLYFMSPKCGMCKNITPFIDQLSRERDDVIRIDAAEQPQVAREFKVMGTPAFIVINNGAVEKVKLGAISRRKITALLENKT